MIILVGYRTFVSIVIEGKPLLDGTGGKNVNLFFLVALVVFSLAAFSVSFNCRL